MSECETDQTIIYSPEFSLVKGTSGHTCHGVGHGKPTEQIESLSDFVSSAQAGLRGTYQWLVHPDMATSLLSEAYLKQAVKVNWFRQSQKTTPQDLILQMDRLLNFRCEDPQCPEQKTREIFQRMTNTTEFTKGAPSVGTNLYNCLHESIEVTAHALIHKWKEQYRSDQHGDGAVSDASEGYEKGLPADVPAATESESSQPC